MLDEIINRLMQDEDVREIPVKYIAVFISVVSTVIRESEEEELADAKHYAQRYEEYKTSRNTFAKMYYDMAKDELEHAKYLKIMGQVAIEKANEAITAQIMEMWTNCMNEYAEHTAMLKMML